MRVDCRQPAAPTNTMKTAGAVMSLLVMLAITSSVTSAYHLQSPDDVSQLAPYDVSDPFHVISQSPRDDAGDDVIKRRAPGWGKRHDDVLESLSQYATSKRRGWGKRDTGRKCSYWRSLLQIIEVRALQIAVVTSVP